MYSCGISSLSARKKLAATLRQHLNHTWWQRPGPSSSCAQRQVTLCVCVHVCGHAWWIGEDACM